MLRIRVGAVGLIFLFLSSADFTLAQTRMGIKGGMNLSGYRRTPDTKIGYQVGLAGKHYLGNLGWFVQPEVFYSREGNVNQPLEFVNVPVIAGFDFGDNFNIHAGLQAGFLVGQGDNDPEYNSVNAVFNFGFEFYTFKKTSIGFRFDYGLNDFEKSTGTAITYNFGVYIIAWLKQ